MDNPIVGFIKILTDNNIIPKYREIPDEFDLKDELLAEIEIEMEGNLPDSMRYFEINGFSSPVDLEEFLDNEFNTFKLTIISDPVENHSILFHEIQDQITKAKAELLLKEQSLKQIKDITLNALVILKIKYCDKVLNLINAGSDINDKPVNPKVQEKKTIYVFRIKKSADNTRGYVLSQMHKELKKAGYIDCSLGEFKKLFIGFVEKKPDLTPQPIIWKDKTYNHFAYFIQCINRSFLAYSRSPSNTDISINLFYKANGGTYFTPSKKRFDGKVDHAIKKQFDTIMKRIGLPQKTTLP
jgi:hypothetical protein